MSCSNRVSEIYLNEHLKPTVFPIGMHDFRKTVTTTKEFVDKTYFIKEIIDCDEEAMLITRPRRWGKSMNMDMLCCFFRREVDKEGRAFE